MAEWGTTPGVRISRAWAILLVIAGTVVGCTTTESAYSRAQRLDALPGYQEYLKSNPSGPEAETAKTRVAELEEEAAFRTVEDQNTPAAYRAFAASQPTNKYAGEATRRASASEEEALGWTVQIGSKAAYAGFAASYPQSLSLPEVQDRLRWLDTAKIAFAVEGGSEPEFRTAFGPMGADPRVVVLPFGTALDGRGVSVALTLRLDRTVLDTKGGPSPNVQYGARRFCIFLGALGGRSAFILVTLPAGALCTVGVLAVTAATTTTVGGENWEVTVHAGDLAPAVDFYHVIPVATLTEVPGHRRVLAAVWETDLLVWLSIIPTLPARIARAALRHPDGAVVAEVGRTLARRDPFPFEFFSAMVDEAPVATRRAAVLALGQSRDGRAVPPLIRVLATDASPDGEIRAAAAKGLAALGDRRTVEPLIRALADPAEDVRDAAATALGDLEDRRAIAPLIACLADPGALVRWQAATTLRRLTGEDFGTDQAKWQAWWEQNRTNPSTP